MKRKPSEWEKITVNETTVKGLIFNPYNSKTGKQTSQSKSGEKTETDISPKKTYRWLTNT